MSWFSSTISSVLGSSSAAKVGTRDTRKPARGSAGFVGIFAKSGRNTSSCCRESPDGGQSTFASAAWRLVCHRTCVTTLPSTTHAAVRRVLTVQCLRFRTVMILRRFPSKEQAQRPTSPAVAPCSQVGGNGRRTMCLSTSAAWRSTSRAGPRRAASRSWRGSPCFDLVFAPHAQLPTHHWRQHSRHAQHAHASLSGLALGSAGRRGSQRATPGRRWPSSRRRVRAWCGACAPHSTGL